MLCTACGNQAVVVGRFCSSCDGRARSGYVERRRPVGGAQWQALWGISYAPAQETGRRSRRWQGGIAMTVIVVGILLTF
jgi:hypothetical protein